MKVEKDINAPQAAPRVIDSRISVPLSGIAKEQPTETIPTRILVVDDEWIVTEVVKRYLKLEGYGVAIAADGAEALKVAQQVPRI